MIHECKQQHDIMSKSKLTYSPDDFTRFDESNDFTFYSQDRFVNHLDSLALSSVRSLIGELVIEDNPVILDLMAGWDSHIPESIRSKKVVGLGLNRNELDNNPALNQVVIHDINADPILPFPDDTFDVVVNTLSIAYIKRPFEVFSEVGRILRQGGLFLVIFSNRMFLKKAVKIWREADDDERIILVEDFFNTTGKFEKPTLFISRGKPRPESDKYFHLGIPSDPVYALYADKKSTFTRRNPRPNITSAYGKPLDNRELRAREKSVGKTLCCPHCGERLSKWAVPDNPFCQTWDNEYMFICFNDHCPYYVRGWELMYRQTNKTMSYRFMYNPDKDCTMPIPVPSAKALKDGIIL
ncbi:Methyltransferase domain protein [uncultured Desulfobacterium sp.]|uniref:Methyltransferase domain protein n=1 Tax=uncultured Desulfobacterium sp. TaxID=201089 RepID=A0A445MV53_9BACT|nr:Methyltransferase domain protein [uncultured Desulfobacterium sp.]